MKEVYWHLPGFCYFRLLNQVIINMMEDYPECFREGYKVGSVYGSFPGAIWNGGRTVSGIARKGDIETILKKYNDKGVPVRFTWTNSLLEQEHVYDTYCNLIMRLGDNGLNQVLVNRPVLEEYIRKNYPKYPLISSTTKRITDVDGLLEELKKDYHLVVLDYDLNKDEEALQKFAPFADRLEILVNEVCYPGCPKRSEHYLQQSKLQLEFETNTGFPCPNNTTKRTFEECKKRPSFLSTEDVAKYVDMGFVNFKIVGRGMPMEFVVDSYLYYLVKEEKREFIRGKIESLFKQFNQARPGAVRK